MDEVQYTIPRSWYKPIIFETEEEAKNYKHNFPTPLHYSEKLGKWYLDGDNELNHTIKECIQKTIKILGLRVDLTYEWSAGSSWAECH